jgi:hypothetical protein
MSFQHAEIAPIPFDKNSYISLENLKPNHNLMKNKFLIILLFIFACFFNASGQPYYKQSALDSTAIFYQISADFNAWLDSVQLPDSIKTREIKKFGRWASFWQTRVQHSDSMLFGSFIPYQKAMGTYWVNPSCLGSDPAEWENAGPYPEDLHNMGLIQSIWFDNNNPDFILIGSGRRSGIMKTTDRGQTWQDVLSQERISALGIPFISASPILEQNGKRTFYAATGSNEVGYSIGIIKSEDDGETWEILNNFPPFANQEYNYVVRKVLAAPVRNSNANPDILFAIARNIFYKSLDGGVTWTSKVLKINNVDFDGTLEDMEVDPFNNNVIAISGIGTTCRNPPIWISTNGGIDFNEIFTNSGYSNLNDVVNIQIDFPSSDRLYVLTREETRGSIFYYDMSQIPAAWNTSNTNNYMIVAGRTNQFNRAFKVSSDLFYYYSGTDCFSISTENAPGHCIFPYEVTANYHPDSRCVEAAGNFIMVGTDGGLMISDDHGTTWMSINGYGSTGLSNNEIWGFDITEGFEPKIVAGLMDNSFKFFDKKWYSSMPLTYDIIYPYSPQWNYQYTDPMGVGDGWKCRFFPYNASSFLIFGCNGLVKIAANNGVFNGTISHPTHPIRMGAGTWGLAPIEINSSKIFFGGHSTNFSNGAIANTNDMINWTLANLGTPAMITKIATAPNNPDIMYATSLHSTYNSTCEKGVFRSEDGGDTWTDITGGTPVSGVRNQNYPVIGITVDWNNPNKVWVCLGGVSFDNFTKLPLLENRVFRTDDASANPVIWIDMTGGPNGILPPLPTTAIVNQPGTSRVFLATDGGIFYRDDNDPDWNCFSNNFPVTVITDLLINKETNEIYASTYGYGIWKSTLPCTQTYLTSTVIDQYSGNVTWSNKVMVKGDIYVRNGYSLTIDQNSVIYMGTNSSIFVEQGAKLIVNNATITSSCEDNGMWQGIKVLGMKSLNQTSSNQGMVCLSNNAVIANAIVGVETGNKRFSGGIIQADNSGFYNCQYAVKMHPYQNFDPNKKSLKKADLSHFKECTFATTSELQNPGLFPKSFIYLNCIHQLQINGNSFENRDPDKTNRINFGNGIECYHSLVNITEKCTAMGPSQCTQWIPNTFKGLHYGVYAMSGQTGIPININKAEFIDNRCGAYLGSMSSAKVTSSLFVVPPDIIRFPYGLYLDYCTGYTIEENHFENLIPQSLRTVGIIVNNSGSDCNRVYNNNLYDLGYGILAQHDNRGQSPFSGLQIKCNDFSDVQLCDLGISMNETYSGISGISEYQGGDADVRSPAGNTFSWMGQNPYSDINNNGLPISKYYHHDMQGYTPASGEIWVPKYYNSPKVFLDEADGKYYVKNIACPSNPGGNMTTLSQLYDSVQGHQVNLNSAQLVLAIWKDGGIPELPEQVELAFPWETYQYYNLLMLESPYLSDETLIAAINNTDLLPDLLLKLILIANPQCTRSADVMAALEARNPQLPEYMLEEIMLGAEVPSPLESLEATVSHFLHERQYAVSQIKMVYLNDTTNLSSQDSLLALLDRDEFIEAKYEKACLYLAQEEYELLDAWIAAIQYYTDGEPYQNQQYAEYAAYFPIIAAIQQDTLGFDALTSEQKERLDSLAENGHFFPAAYARAILSVNDSTFSYEEPVVFPGIQSPRKRNPIPYHLKRFRFRIKSVSQPCT